MRQRIARVLQSHPFWVSLLLHVLLVISFSLIITFQPRTPPTPSLEVPAYVYRETMTPRPQQSIQKKMPSSSNGILKPVSQKRVAAQPSSPPKVEKIKQETQPIHLIGDKKTPPKPLVKLLGKALAAHLVYPKIAVDFNLKGTTFVGFTLYPDGSVMGARIVKSSGADILDKAALDGVNAMAPLKEIGLYLQEPKFLVVGIIFSGDEPVGRLMI
jgi:TonB family protein